MLYELKIISPSSLPSLCYSRSGKWNENGRQKEEGQVRRGLVAQERAWEVIYYAGKA